MKYSNDKSYIKQNKPQHFAKLFKICLLDNILRLVYNDVFMLVAATNAGFC